MGLTCYRLNTPDVVHETVEGEVLVVHTRSGVYFSLNGTAEHIWNALLSGHTAQEIAGAYGVDADGSQTEILAAIEGFVENLVKEQLLVPSERHAASGSLRPAPNPFSTPVAQKFTDMQDLLLVDPIHEVDPKAGWPNLPQSREMPRKSER